MALFLEPVDGVDGGLADLRVRVVEQEPELRDRRVVPVVLDRVERCEVAGRILSKQHEISGCARAQPARISDAEDVETLATLPTRDQLLSMIASAVSAPIQNIAAQVNELLVGVARAVDAVREQKEEAGGE